MAKTATRQVSIFINGKEVEGSIKNIAAAFRQAQNELAGMVVGSDKYIAKLEEVQGLKGRLDDHNQSIRGTKKGYDLLSAGANKFIGIAAGAFAVDNLLAFGKHLFNTASSMDALQKKAKVVFGDTLPLINAEAEENARAMGLTNAQYVAAAAGIQDLLVPMGFQRKEAAGISAELVNLSGALSEWTGGQVSSTEVSNILSKALLGEREELKQLGISLSDADLKAALAAKGLDKLTGAALEQAKATTTLDLILAKSTDAQAAYADGAGSLVRQQAEASAKIQEVAEKLATLLLPVFNRLISVAGGFVEAVEGVVGVIGDIVGSFSDLTDVQERASKGTRESQAEFNALIGVLKNVNTTEETRNRAIDQLTAKYPSYIGNVDLHKASEGTLNTVLQKGNDLFAKRIFLQEKEAVIQDLEGRRNDLQQSLLEAEKKLATAQSRTDTGFTFGLKKEQEVAKFTNVVSATKQQLEILQSEQDKFLESQEEFAKRFNLTETVTNNTTTGTGTGTTTTTAPTVDTSKAKQAAEKLQTELQTLIQKTTEFSTQLLNEQSETELTIAIRNVETRYDAEIEKAKELEAKGVEEATAQRIALEQLKQQAIGRAAEEVYDQQQEVLKQKAYDSAKAQAEAEIQANEETEAFKKDQAQQRAEAEAELKAFTQEGLLTDQEAEIAQLEAQYQQLLLLADEFGGDSVALTASYEAQKQKILEESGAKQLAQQKAIQDAQTELKLAQLSALGEGAALLEGFFEQGSAAAKALFLFQKAVAAVEIIVNLQKELAGIAASNAALGPAAPAVVAALSAAAKVRAGIRIATIAATSIKEVAGPKTKQKAAGGALGPSDQQPSTSPSYGHSAQPFGSPSSVQRPTSKVPPRPGQRVRVTGETDHRPYTATFLAPPDTGLLPPSPVVFTSAATGQPVLASERGAEYFIASHHLTHPVVNYHARAIDLITHGGRGVRQFAEGGVNTSSPIPSALSPQPSTLNPQSSADTAMQRELLNAVSTLNALLSRGIVAVIPDGTVVDIRQRFDKINGASGGFYG